MLGSDHPYVTFCLSQSGTLASTAPRLNVREQEDMYAQSSERMH